LSSPIPPSPARMFAFEARNFALSATRKITKKVYAAFRIASEIKFLANRVATLTAAM
jgi:hypothetical protein